MSTLAEQWVSQKTITNQHTIALGFEGLKRVLSAGRSLTPDQLASWRAVSR
ncbi:hypothetical protein ACQ4M4_20070 [Leptolyngbya sp. AN02str]|uniref:hypothetical protein n=1 Tax=Leptolyngbya sp. AN02str TaxID=3423363 RepID=UPI003D31AC0B